MSVVTLLLLKDHGDLAPEHLGEVDFPEIPPVPSPLVLKMPNDEEQRFQIVSWFYKGALQTRPIPLRNSEMSRPGTGKVRLHLLIIRASPIARPQTPGLIV